MAHVAKLVVFIFLAVVFVDSALAASGPDGQELQITTPEGFGTLKPGTVETVKLSDIDTWPADERARTLEHMTQQRNRGWIDATEDQVGVVDNYFDHESVRVHMRPSIADVAHVLAIEPASLRSTILADARLTGVMPGGGFVNGGYTGIVRTLIHPQLGRLVLIENDYVKAGSHIKIATELVDDIVNGKPALYTVYKSASGKSYTELQWFTDSKGFTLLVDGRVSKTDEAFAELSQLRWDLY